MNLDRKDLEMMCISVPVVDYWEMKEDIDRLQDAINRLEKILEAFLALYGEERVKGWELILKEMLRKQEQKKGNRDARKF